MTNPQTTKPEACQCCDFTTMKLRSFPAAYPRTEDKWLCDLCASTMTSRCADEPQLYPNLELMKTICYVGNAIIKAMETNK